MTDQVFIQHRFTVTEGDKSYSDAIVLPQADYNKLSSQDIETQKQTRFNTWKTIISTPPPVLTKTEQLAAIAEQKKTLQDQLVVLTAQEADLGGK